MFPLPSPSLSALRLSSSLRQLPVVVIAGLAQVGAGIATFLGAFSAAQVGYAVPGLALLFGHSLSALAMARMLKLPSWWLVIEFLFMPAVVAALSLQIPAGWFLAAFVAFSLVYWSTYRTRVPLYLSGRSVWRELENALPERPQARILDLGSGLGGPMLYLAKRRPDLRIEGVEAAPLPAAFSMLRAIGCRNLRFRWGSFWRHDLSQYDVVFAYLSPAAMPDLWQKVKAEMQPGSLFISHEFVVPGVEADEIVRTGLGDRARLYLWRL
jgi:hypothetical protein